MAGRGAIAGRRSARACAVAPPLAPLTPLTPRCHSRRISSRHWSANIPAGGSGAGQRRRGRAERRPGGIGGPATAVWVTHSRGPVHTGGRQVTGPRSGQSQLPRNCLRPPEFDPFTRRAEPAAPYLGAGGRDVNGSRIPRAMGGAGGRGWRGRSWRGEGLPAPLAPCGAIHPGDICGTTDEKCAGAGRDRGRGEIGGRGGRGFHSTVTDFARLRGWSTSVPLATAV